MVKKEFLVERQGKQFVLYAGLLDMAHEQKLSYIVTSLLQIPTDDNGHVAICQATVMTERGTYSGIGDASPGNVGKMIVPHLIRMAETRAKARALRDAVNVGVAALEELGDDEPEQPAAKSQQPTHATFTKQDVDDAAAVADKEHKRRDMLFQMEDDAKAKYGADGKRQLRVWWLERKFAGTMEKASYDTVASAYRVWMEQKNAK